MDVDTARRILKVSDHASIDEIRSRYRYLAKIFHPDIPNTGDAKQFALISAAYLALQADNVGIHVTSRVEKDLSDAFLLKQAIEAHVTNAVEDFFTGLDEIEEHALRDLRRVIFGCNSRSELQDALSNSVPMAINNANARVRVLTKRLAKDIGRANSDFLFEVFREMYRENRKYWLFDLYRNKAVVLGIIGETFVFILTEVPSVYTQLPTISSLTSSMGLVYIIPIVALLTLTFQFILLNPRRQFLPPALSTASVHRVVTTQKDGMPLTLPEAGFTGTLVGGTFGVLVFEPITLAVAAIGGLIGLLFGKRFSDIQEEVWQKLAQHLRSAVGDLRRDVKKWADRTKADLHDASMNSVGANLKRIRGMVERRKQITSGIITDERRHLR